MSAINFDTYKHIKPNLPLLESVDWEELNDWELREVSKDAKKEMVEDIKAYCDWALDSIRGEGERTQEEGNKLFAKVLFWKPNMFPKKSTHNG